MSNPYDVFTATDEEVDNLTPAEDKAPTEYIPDEEDNTSDSAVEKSNVPESKETEVDKEDETNPADLLTMSDEEFEKETTESFNEPKESSDEDDKVETSNSEVEKEEDVEKNPAEKSESDTSTESTEKIPSIEELQAKVAKAEKLVQHKDSLEVLESNGLLKTSTVNKMVDIAKGNKEAMFAHMRETGVTAEDVMKHFGIQVPAENPTTKPDTKEESTSEADTQSDDGELNFDDWLNGISGDNKPETDKPEPVVEEPVAEEPVDNKAPGYTPTDHYAEAQNRKIGMIAQELVGSDGQNFLDDLDQRIDTGSYEMLRKNPEELRALADQKRSGVMDLIEERMRILDESGMFPEGIPYLTRYQFAGNMLIHEASHKPEPIDRKVAKPTTVDDSAVKHASPTTTDTGSKGKTINPYDVFTMSEEQFEKMS